MKLENIRAHQAALQAIADANGGTRADNTPGFTASADYVAGVLEAAGYQVTRPTFNYSVLLRTVELEQIAPSPRAYAFGGDFFFSAGGGNGEVTASVTVVDFLFFPPGSNMPGTFSTSGCEAADFAGFPAGNIALVQRGVCNFSVKVDNAVAAGASGVLIMNEGNDPTRVAANVQPNVGGPQPVPVLFTTYTVGVEMVNAGAALVVRMLHNAVAENRTSENVIADSPGGTPNNVVVVGAHLDSVPAGPGINDNGSGTAAILETAVQMAKLGHRYDNKVRFAFWGAEELGLIGSTAYVNQLAAAGQLDTIALNLNFDMVGSPNFVRFVYDGDGSAFGLVGPGNSDEIERVFVEFFAHNDLETEPTAFDGRSDYRAFILAGIPAGGLFTGAEVRKTAALAAVYGGTVGEQFDPCYHQACDTFANNSDEVLQQMSQAIAHAVSHWAQRTDGPIAERGNRRPVPADAMPFRGNEAMR